MHWKDIIRLHEYLVTAESHFFENKKKMLLENISACVGTLRDEKDQTDQHVIRSEKYFTCDQLSNILSSAATNNYSQISSSSSKDREKYVVPKQMMLSSPTILFM